MARNLTGLPALGGRNSGKLAAGAEKIVYLDLDKWKTVKLGQKNHVSSQCRGDPNVGGPILGPIPHSEWLAAEGWDI